MALGQFRISCPTEIHFGASQCATSPEHLPAGCESVLVVRGGSGRASGPVTGSLKDRGTAFYEISIRGEPSLPMLQTALAESRGRRIEAVVAVGGGSVLDSGKALAALLSHDLTLGEDFSALPAEMLAQPGRIPCIALPTTAGTGAEVTANAVIDLPNQKAKVSLRGRALYPAKAIIDHELMIGAPRDVRLHAGLDALTQVVEAYTSSFATPFTDALTRSAISQALQALPGAVAGEADPAAMAEMAWVALSSGLALANGGLGAAHGLSSILGGQFGAPHGALCGRLLLPVLRANAETLPEGSEGLGRIETVNRLVAEAFPPEPGGDALSGLEAWMNGQGLPRLAAYDVTGLPDLAARALEASSTQKNPVRLSQAAMERILSEAL